MLHRGTVALIALLVVAGTASPAEAGRFTFRGTVTQVTDGDTLVVRLANGSTSKVRLIGIDAAERGECYASQATQRARGLALGKRVVLKGDITQATRDRYRRLLAYVWLPGGKDLGFQLLRGGFAKVYVYGKRFERYAAYRTAEKTGKSLAKSVWKCGSPAPPPPPAANCDPSYPDVCIPPYDQVGDLDCAHVPYTNFRVTGRDPHGFDGDADGVGCED